MLQYKIQFITPNKFCSVTIIGQNISIPFDPANTDYQRFKADIAAGEILQDADGNVMSADDAQAFVATLP